MNDLKKLEFINFDMKSKNLSLYYYHYQVFQVFIFNVE